MALGYKMVIQRGCEVVLKQQRVRRVSVAERSKRRFRLVFGPDNQRMDYPELLKDPHKVPSPKSGSSGGGQIGE